MPTCDGLTDGRKHGDSIDRASIASRGKKDSDTTIECFLANVNVYVTFAICHRRSDCRLSSVCLSVCLSSVTLVHPTQPVEIFGNLFSPYDSAGTLVF